MTTTKPDGASAEHRKLAEQLRTAKDPEKVLRKAAPKGKWTPLLWELAAAGLVSPLDDPAVGDDLPDLLQASAAEAPWELVRATLGRLEEGAFASSTRVRSFGRNHAKNARAWADAFSSLPPVAQLTLASARLAAGEAVPPELVERGLDLLARATVSGEGDGTTYGARDLGEDGEPFLRRIGAVLADADPATIAQGRTIVEALRFAPWKSVVAYVERHGGAGLTETLLARQDPALEVLALLAPRADGYSHLNVVVPLAGRQGVALPASVDAHVIEALTAGVEDPAFVDGLRMIPRERLRAIHRAAVKACEDEVSKMAHALLLHLDDDETVQLAEDALARAIEEDDTFRMVEALGEGGDRGAAVLERAHARLSSTVRSALGAKHRIDLRRGLIRAVRHTPSRLLAALLPDDDIVYLESLSDLFASDDDAKALLALLPEADQTRVQESWAALDWNGGLRTEDFLGAEPEQLDVEEAPWPALRSALAKTSLSRMDSNAFARTDAPLAERAALAEQLLGRDDAAEHRDKLAIIAYEVREELGEAELAPGSTWDRLILFGLQGESSAQDWYGQLPAAAVERWAATLSASDEEEKHALAEELRALVRPEDEDEGEPGATDDASREDPIERVRRLAAGAGQPCDTRIYALVARDAPGAAPGCRTAARPLGIAEGDLPSWNGEPMEHVITLDFTAMPELRERAGFGDDVAAVAVFISSRASNEAFTSGSGETAVVPLGATELSRGHEEEGGGWYDAVALDVPAAVFDSAAAADDEGLAAVRQAVFQLEARALGAPRWIQPGDDEDEDDATGFLAQLHDDLVPGLNCGDGDLYVFVDDAYWLT